MSDSPTGKEVTPPLFSPTSIKINPVFPQRYDPLGSLGPFGRDADPVVISRGMLDASILFSGDILKPGENIYKSDSFVFICHPVPPDAPPDTKHLRTPTVERTNTDSLGPQLASLIQKELQEFEKQWGEGEEIRGESATWRWVTVYPPENPTPEVARFFRDHHVRTGEGLSFIAIKNIPESNNPPPSTQLAASSNGSK